MHYNNYDFLCGNILEGQANWRDKTKGLSNLIIVKQSTIYQRMDVGARKLIRRLGSIKGIGFFAGGRMNLLPSKLT